ncbi:flagellar protein FlaG [Thermocrinis ruber]|jgi:flagellar protein FlaG|uniref:Flagellar protein FlaG n=1 Tax=Thermocrinis ruber TaxID=75906 RepID=W0DAZ8_9AQUI|nr:flagellar protein FlaG [Thermocrinis ruber]AHE95421.1 flagellar protein FlaG [Thermocrinis ruber]
MRVGRVDQSFEYVDVKLNQQQVQPMDGALRKLQKEVDQQVQDAQEKRDIKPEELQKLIEEVKRKFDMLSKYLKIDIDQELEIPVVKIMEKDTNRVIRQIPPEYLLELMKRIDQLLGLLMERKV